MGEPSAPAASRDRQKGFGGGALPTCELVRRIPKCGPSVIEEFPTIASQRRTCQATAKGLNRLVRKAFALVEKLSRKAALILSGLLIVSRR